MKKYLSLLGILCLLFIFSQSAIAQSNTEKTKTVVKTETKVVSKSAEETKAKKMSDAEEAGQNIDEEMEENMETAEEAADEMNEDMEEVEYEIDKKTEMRKPVNKAESNSKKSNSSAPASKSKK